MDIKWQNITTLTSKSYRCGHCGHEVASNQGYFSNAKLEGHQAFLYVCPHCAKPTFVLGTMQMPDVSPGNPVGHLPADIAALYEEARDCVAASAYTAAVLVCRKLLMNLAVNQGAGTGLKFIEYVDYLASRGFVPPNGRGWVDHIRKKGNEATHEIQLMTRDDAVELIAFSEMLLKFIYEFPARVPAT
jgi:hypothetical protein